MIALHFGKQLQGDLYDTVQDWAIKYELTIEDATNDCYKYITRSLSEVNNNWHSHFDIMLSDVFQCLVIAPVITFSITDYDGFKTPTLLFHSNYLKERYAVKRHFISNELLNKFGDDFEHEFGLEFLGFEYVKNTSELSISLNNCKHRSPPLNAVIYLIGEKPHFYDGNQFLPVMA